MSGDEGLLCCGVLSDGKGVEDVQGAHERLTGRDEEVEESNNNVIPSFGCG